MPLSVLYFVDSLFFFVRSLPGFQTLVYILLIEETNSMSALHGQILLAIMDFRMITNRSQGGMMYFDPGIFPGASDSLSATMIKTAN